MPLHMLREALEAGTTVEALAARMGCTHETAKVHAVRLGYRRPPQIVGTKHESILDLLATTEKPWLAHQEIMLVAAPHLRGLGGVSGFLAVAQKRGWIERSEDPVVPSRQRRSYLVRGYRITPKGRDALAWSREGVLRREV